MHCMCIDCANRVIAIKLGYDDAPDGPSGKYNLAFFRSYTGEGLDCCQSGQFFSFRERKMTF